MNHTSAGSSQEEGKPEATEIMNKFMHMGFRERWRRTVTLWPYIVPLVLVYFAEYSMQVGTQRASFTDSGALLPK